MRTNAHTNFSERRGRYTDFLCKKQYVASTADRSQDQPHDVIINTYYKSVDSSSTCSIYDTLLLYLKNKYRFNASLTQAPNSSIATLPN